MCSEPLKLYAEILSRQDLLGSVGHSLTEFITPLNLQGVSSVSVEICDQTTFPPLPFADGFLFMFGSWILKVF